MLRVRYKETGDVFDAIEFNEAVEDDIIDQIYAMGSNISTERIGNIYKITLTNRVGHRLTVRIAYSDIVILDNWGKMLFALPEARFNDRWEALTFDEIMNELRDFAEQIFTPEGVELLMSTPQPGFEGLTGREYARIKGWEKLRSWLVGWYEGGIT